MARPDQSYRLWKPELSGPRIMHSSQSHSFFHILLNVVSLLQHTIFHVANIPIQRNQMTLPQGQDGIYHPNMTIEFFASVGGMGVFRMSTQVFQLRGSTEPILYASTRLMEKGMLVVSFGSRFQPPSRSVACQP